MSSTHSTKPAKSNRQSERLWSNPRLLRLRGNESVTKKLFLMTEALPTEARHETRAGVVLPNSGVFAPITPHLNLVDVAMRTANCIPSTEIVVATTDQHQVHAVVVDMPQRASLEYASPESWGTLPTFDPPNEESPTASLGSASVIRNYWR